MNLSRLLAASALLLVDLSPSLPAKEIVYYYVGQSDPDAKLPASEDEKPAREEDGKAGEASPISVQDGQMPYLAVDEAAGTFRCGVVNPSQFYYSVMASGRISHPPGEAAYLFEDVKWGKGFSKPDGGLVERKLIKFTLQEGALKVSIETGKNKTDFLFATPEDIRNFATNGSDQDGLFKPLELTLGPAPAPKEPESATLKDDKEKSR